jgi:splicing suppressor protein 51
MRVEDEYRFGGDASAVHRGEDSMDEFREFLKLVERRETLLPSWWNAQKRLACEQSAVRAENWSNINQAIEKSDIREHYQDNMMPMKLRVLGEQIYGKGFL